MGKQSGRADPVGRESEKGHSVRSAGNRPPEPASPPADLPYPLTFFLTARQRAWVLRVLRRIDRDRAAALCRVLEQTEGGDT